MNSTIMPAQQSQEISQNPSDRPVYDCCAISGWAFVGVDVTATSKVRTRVHKADLIASWKMLCQESDMITSGFTAKRNSSNFPFYILNPEILHVAWLQMKNEESDKGHADMNWMHGYLLSRWHPVPFGNIYISKLTVHTEKLLLYFYSFHG